MNAQQAYRELSQDRGFSHAANWLFVNKPGRATKLLKLRDYGYTNARLDLSSAIDDVLILTSENEIRRLTMKELDALKFSKGKPVFQKIVDPEHEANKAIVKSGVCPVCGRELRRNWSLAGWYQCSQFGAKPYRADPSKPSCDYQVFI